MSNDKSIFQIGGPINSLFDSKIISGEFVGGRINLEKQIEDESNKEIAEEYKEDTKDLEIENKVEQGEEAVEQQEIFKEQEEKKDYDKELK